MRRLMEVKEMRKVNGKRRNAIVKMLSTIDRRNMNAGYVTYINKYNGKDYLYIMYRDKVLIKVNSDTTEAVHITSSKNGQYSDICIYGVNIPYHIINRLCFDEQYAQDYLNGVDVVINHTVTSLDLYDGSYIPHCKMQFDSTYFEVVSRGLNSEHGRFIKKYALHDIYVSANHLMQLKSLKLIDMDMMRDSMKEIYDLISKADMCCMYDTFRDLSYAGVMRLKNFENIDKILDEHGLINLFYRIVANYDRARAHNCNVILKYYSTHNITMPQGVDFR